MATPSPPPQDYSQVVLAGIVLEGFELPNTLTLGGDQRLVINEFIGNYRRQVSPLGSQPRAITWRGVFLYESALARARLFDALRTRGQAVTFVWGDYQFIVVIDRFYYDPANRFHIDYEISLTVARDLTLVDAIVVPSKDTINAGILNTIALMQSLVAEAQRLIGLVDAARKGDIAGIATGVEGLARSINTLAPLINLATTPVLQGLVSQAANIAFLTKTIAGKIDQTKSGNPLTEIFELAAEAVILKGQLSLLAGNTGTQQVTVMNRSLFDVAQQYYGTTDAWSSIADANGLTDAQVVEPTTLKLPPFEGEAPRTVPTPGTVYEAPGTGAPVPAESIEGGTVTPTTTNIPVFSTTTPTTQGGTVTTTTTGR